MKSLLRTLPLIGLILALNTDPYGQKSLLPFLPWGPDARKRRAAKKQRAD